jgi:hypothetical protein
VGEGLEKVLAAVRPDFAAVYALAYGAQAGRYARLVRARIALGLLIAGGGAVWVLQGLRVGFAPRSFMTGDPLWVLIGALAVVGGLALAWVSWRRGAPGRD